MCGTTDVAILGRTRHFDLKTSGGDASEVNDQRGETHSAGGPWWIRSHQDESVVPREPPGWALGFADVFFILLRNHPFFYSASYHKPSTLGSSMYGNSLHIHLGESTWGILDFGPRYIAPLRWSAECHGVGPTVGNSLARYSPRGRCRAAWWNFRTLMVGVVGKAVPVGVLMAVASMLHQANQTHFEKDQNALEDAIPHFSVLLASSQRLLSGP